MLKADLLITPAGAFHYRNTYVNAGIRNPHSIIFL